MDGLVGWLQARGISDDPLDAFEVQEFGKPVVVPFVGVERPPRLSSGVAQATQLDKYFAEPTQDNANPSGGARAVVGGSISSPLLYVQVLLQCDICMFVCLFVCLLLGTDFSSRALN